MRVRAKELSDSSASLRIGHTNREDKQSRVDTERTEHSKRPACDIIIIVIGLAFMRCSLLHALCPSP